MTSATAGVASRAPATASVSCVPVLYLFRGVRPRQFTNRHVRLRERRALAFFVGVISHLVGLALMTVLAPGAARVGSGHGGSGWCGWSG